MQDIYPKLREALPKSPKATKPSNLSKQREGLRRSAGY